MTYKEDKHKQAKSDMLGEFNKALLDAEDLRKAAVSGDGSAAALEILEEKQRSLAAAAAVASKAVVEAEREKAEAADDREIRGNCP